MSGSNRLLAILLGALATLVAVVGVLSATLLLTNDDDGGADDPPSASDDGTPAAAGRLRLASGDPITLDPHRAGDALSAEYIVEIFGGLVTITRDLEIVPDLAREYEVSEDGMVYTFSLRDDAVFHSGRAVTAEDVKWLDRARRVACAGFARRDRLSRGHRWSQGAVLRH